MCESHFMVSDKMVHYKKSSGSVHVSSYKKTLKKRDPDVKQVYFLTGLVPSSKTSIWLISFKHFARLSTLLGTSLQPCVEREGARWDRCHSQTSCVECSMIRKSPVVVDLRYIKD